MFGLPLFFVSRHARSVLKKAHDAETEFSKPHVARYCVPGVWSFIRYLVVL